MAKEDKKQLVHPEGKKSPAISRDKYDILKKAIKEILKAEKQLTHTELALAIEQYLKKNKIKFEGSVNWFGEWVKLHMLAKGKLKLKTDKDKKVLALK